MGGSVTWKFESHAERAAYEPCRKGFLKRRDFSGLLLAVMFMALVSPWAIDVFGLLLFIALALFLMATSQIEFVRRGYLEGRYGLSAAELVFRPDRLILKEEFGKKTMVLGIISSGNLKSAQWLADGCSIETGAWYSPRKRFLLPFGFFKSPESNAALQEWAENNGVEIEGVPPLGVYPRPIGTGGML